MPFFYRFFLHSHRYHSRPNFCLQKLRRLASCIASIAKVQRRDHQIARTDEITPGTENLGLFCRKARDDAVVLCVLRVTEKDLLRYQHGKVIIARPNT